MHIVRTAEGFPYAHMHSLRTALRILRTAFSTQHASLLEDDPIPFLPLCWQGHWGIQDAGTQEVVVRWGPVNIAPLGNHAVMTYSPYTFFV
jgi:hypothetical protein